MKTLTKFAPVYISDFASSNNIAFPTRDIPVYAYLP